MRTTQLMELTKRYNGGNAVMADTRFIHGIIYLLAEKAEIAFGPQLITKLEADLIYTQTGVPTRPVLERIMNMFMEDYLFPIVAYHDSTQNKLLGLDPLSEETQTDYFITFMELEKASNRQRINSLSNLQGMLSAYASNQPAPICQGVVDFFVETKSPENCIELISRLCVFVKNYNEED